LSRVNGEIEMAKATSLEKENLEAHVDLCQERYKQLEGRLGKIEEKVEDIHRDITEGQTSLTKVLIGTAGTIVAGLLSTIIVILLNVN
jgi:tetrahydromethanopterin S-methyltransferase subunit G